MNYIGSKLSLLPFIEESIEKVIPKDLIGNSIFCDLFAGTGIVGSYFKKKDYTVYSNDIQYYSYVLIKHFIENNEPLDFYSLTRLFPELKGATPEERLSFILLHLNHLEGEEGFIYNHYCVTGEEGSKFSRRYFTDENGKKCDAIRKELEIWKKNAYVSENEYFYFLAILLESIDKVANTASVYEAFLKDYKKTALKPITLKPLDIIINDKHNKVFNEDINTLISTIQGDILYLDPPYNRRQYASNYHILETIAKYDTPEITGKTGIRKEPEKKSLYCSKVKATDAFDHLIQQAKFKYIFLSYNDEGIIPLDTIESIMSKRGKYGRFEQSYRRYKADNNRKYAKDDTIEYLHYVIVDQ
ncbi:adenine-specific DNA-methyltransferase [Natranaerovirga pectinivora]|uniref:site-specific DNA-methyltransferase (adenine-specific) n=1 Tax=Natranaerovirga pectinivora TaxID=682400 RepID=A0A4R3MQW2_9FIRM|nr:DNA adenine methylase [Natranaerovirga pectinivora]TCT16306.1 adenine-specific DNA-methyltransferase [Natranaerovirga pectinivora]